MFESISGRLGTALARLRGRGRLSEADVDEVLGDIRTALLEADVSTEVVRAVVARIRSRAIGAAPSPALDPGQQVVKIVRDELVALLGGETLAIRYASKPPTVVLMAGLQGSGKTPTCIYMAMQYGVYAANYPFTEDDFDSKQLPASVRNHTRKLYGLTIAPTRLQQIRNERRPGSRYSSIAQCEFEVRSAENLFQRHGIPCIDTTECSIEEIASRIIDRMGIERRLRP